VIGVRANLPQIDVLQGGLTIWHQANLRQFSFAGNGGAAELIGDKVRQSSVQAILA
jgi:hypothetical protein